MLQFADKKIEVRCGKHHVFSMREGVEVGRKGKIVPVQISNGLWHLGASFLDG